MTVSAIYAGKVTHRRFQPRGHFLRYRIFQLYLDLDEAPALSRGCRLFGFNRPALLSFYERDHLDGSDTPLRRQVETLVATAGLETGGPVRMLCLPRVLGFVFNPITLYFCHDADGRLTATVYEVNNTFGDRHNYVLPAQAHHDGWIEQQATKRMHVSPFMDMDHQYGFRLNVPTDDFHLAVHVRRGGDLWLTAAFAAARAPFTDKALLKAWLGHPLLTLKVVAGIHAEALRIWLKGVKYRPRPAYVAEEAS